MGIIGPNGSGKSSLLRCLYGVNHPQRGEVLWRNDNLLAMKPRKRAQKISVILQEHSHHLGQSVTEVVAQGLTPHKALFEWSNAHDKKRIDSALIKMDLVALKNNAFEQLSGGEKQRVMLARAQVQNPELLIMDEPTNHLDVHYQIDLLQKVKHMGVSVLASIHDLNLAAAFCDYLLVMDNGRIYEQGTPQRILTKTIIETVFNASVEVDEHPFLQQPTPRVSYLFDLKDRQQEGKE